MKRYFSSIAVVLLVLSIGLGAHASVSITGASVLPEGSVIESHTCQEELDALHAAAESGMGSEMGPLTKVIQVYGILPGYQLAPVGVMLNFENSSTWFGKQQPFKSILKWGFGGFRTEPDGSTKLTGLIVPVGGTIADFKLMEGKMTPLKKPWTNALETGSLVIKPVDITNTKEWVYVYSAYSPEDWNCTQGIIIP